jgi:ABA sandwich protein
MDFRKVDALVAKHVMGFTEGVIVKHTGAQLWSDGGASFSFRPSRDIGDAWKVWERLRLDGPGSGDYFCCMEIRSPVSEGYEVCLRRGSHDDDHSPGKPFVLISQVASAPLAICLAALKAKGIDITALDTHSPS